MSPWRGDPPSPVTVQWTTEGRWGKTGLDQSSTCPPHRPSSLGAEDPHPLALRVLPADRPPGLPNGTVQSVPRGERHNRNTTQGVRCEISSLRFRRFSCKYTVYLVYSGIDWSEDKQDVVFINQAGVDVARIPHSLDGFVQLEAARRKLGLTPDECMLGLETAHNLIIAYLWSQAYQQVYVIPPSVVKSNRGRFRQSGARDDQSDGYLLADILRIDRGRLQPWHPDSLLTRQMRAKVSWIQHLTRASTRLSNRLRSVLLRYYPAALQVFPDLSTQIALEFIRTYPTPEAAAY